MNYLKKKIKTVVHGNNKRKDDDDDFDNYVPEVPPHPSILADNKQPFAPSNFANFNSESSGTDSSFNKYQIGEIQSGNQESSSNEPKLSLDELKAREEEHKKIEKEKLRQQEETKKDCEEWKYFLSLTAKVEAVTSKTQTVLNKLQTDSAVNDISKVEDPTFSDKYDVTAPKTAGAWTAFEESEEFNPADPIFTLPKEEEIKEPVPEPAIEPVVDENTKRIAQELIDDFGFTNPAPGIPVALEPVQTNETFDPFDTSFIDIEAIKSGDCINKPTLIKDIDVGEIDPFDTSYIESSIKKI